MDTLLGTDRVLFYHTNESLDAITTGLDIRGNDRVLAIAGSGDQSFAMVERGAIVTALDRNSAQIDYMRARADALSKGDFEGFLKEELCFQKPQIRSSDEGRLQNIRDNLGNLKILDPKSVSDILSECPEGTFDKIYLSNVGRPCMAGKLIVQALGCLAVGGLVYHSYSRRGYFPGLYDKEVSAELEFRLSSEANEFEMRDFYETNKSYGWHPVVFRKIA